MRSQWCRWIGLGGGMLISPLAGAQLLEVQGPTTLSGTPGECALGDMDGDGRLELVISILGRDEIQVHRSIWKGGFALQAACPVGPYAYHLTLADFNGDGLLDCAAAHQAASGSGSLSVLKGDGKGGLNHFPGSPIPWPFSSPPLCVRHGNLNADAHVDLALAVPSLGAVVVGLGDGAGGFSFLGPFATSSDPRGLEIGDWDNDGDQDVATANHNSNTVSILTNDGSGALVCTQTLPLGCYPYELKAGDLDADGDADLVVTRGGSNPPCDMLELLKNDGQGIFSQFNTLTAGPGVSDVVILDMDGDGDLDIAASNWQGKTVSVFLGPQFQPELGSPYAVAGNAAHIAAGDIDAGGHQDLVVTLWDTQQVQSLLNRLDPPMFFCTSKPSSIPGCIPTLAGSSNTVSKSAGAGSYDLTAAPVPGGSGKPGILIFMRNGLLLGPVSTQFGFLCLNNFQRLGPYTAVPGGTTGVCNGSYLWDFGNIVFNTPQIQVSDTLHLQAWYRDPPNVGGANFTNGFGPLFVVP